MGASCSRLLRPRFWARGEGERRKTCGCRGPPTWWFEWLGRRGAGEHLRARGGRATERKRRLSASRCEGGLFVQVGYWSVSVARWERAGGVRASRGEEMAYGTGAGRQCGSTDEGGFCLGGVQRTGWCLGGRGGKEERGQLVKVCLWWAGACSISWIGPFFQRGPRPCAPITG